MRRVAISRVHPCPFQPRKDFTEDALRELSDSIREQGIVQPLVVRPRTGGADGFELIAGERRLRAAQMVGLTEVPIVVREATDTQVLELALIENLQRENLNALEEAQGYQQLIDQFNLRQEDVATRVGKGRVAVANALRLLKLPPEVQGYLRHGQLTVGHAKVLLSLPPGEDQRLAAQRVIKEGLNVRQTEDLAARWTTTTTTTTTTTSGTHAGGGAGASAGRGPEATQDVHVTALQNKLQERLATKVNLRYRKGKGSVEIRFYSDDELDRILEALGISPD